MKFGWRFRVKWIFVVTGSVRNKQDLAFEGIGKFQYFHVVVSFQMCSLSGTNGHLYYRSWIRSTLQKKALHELDKVKMKAKAAEFM